jgi:hypothetical protein
VRDNVTLPSLDGNANAKIHIFFAPGADDFWSFALVEMALDGVPHVAAKLLQRFGLSKDGMTKCAGRLTAFRCPFDEEYQFVHFVGPTGLWLCI